MQPLQKTLASGTKNISKLLLPHLAHREKGYNSPPFSTSTRRQHSECAAVTEPATLHQTESSQHLTSPRPFHEIPGPLSLPGIGTLYKYLPWGDYKFSRLHQNGQKNFRRYGPLVREKMLPGVFVVWVFHPNDIEKIFREEGRLPERRSHLAIKKYREDRPDLYNSGGLLPTNGETWWRLRKEFQKGLSAPQHVRSYLPLVDQVTQEFVQNRILNCSQQKGKRDFLPELSRLFLELIGLVAFDKRLDCFSMKELDPASLSSRLLEATEKATGSTVELDALEIIWRHWKLNIYSQFEEAMVFIEQVAVRLVEEKIRRMEDHKNTHTSLLDLYLSSPLVDKKDVIGMAVDLLLAGMDTVTYTSCFSLYHLACNPEIQHKLRKEAEEILGKSRTGDRVPITGHTLTQVPYLRAVLKETLRLNPVSVGVGRILTDDLVLSGYQVPAGTVVVTQNQVACRQHQWFREPDKFMPERWLKGHDMYSSRHPFLNLAFGHGKRSCIGRRLAEQNLLIFLLRIVHECEITWEGTKYLDCETKLINRPDKPVLLRFTPVNVKEDTGVSNNGLL